MEFTEDQIDRGWGWFQVPCWFAGKVFQALKPARFSLLVAIIGGLIFIGVPQGIEILRSLAEGDQYHARFGTGDRLRILYFALALLLWAFNSWYWARVLLNARFRDSLPIAVISRNPVRWLRREGPRVLGVAPFLIVAAAFFTAAYRYDSDAAGDPKLALCQMGAGSLVLGALFYFFCVRRRQWMEARGNYLPGEASAPDSERAEFLADDRRFASLHHLRTENAGAFWAVAGLALFSVLLLGLFTAVPVATATSMGSGAILLFAASTWICFGSCVVYLSDRYRLPLIGTLLVLAAVFSVSNDNHAVRLLRGLPTAPPPATQGGANGPIAQAFIDWHSRVQKAYPATKVRPVFIAAAAGGGIRAAYWTATVLGTLEDRSLMQRPANGKTPADFASHLFAVSGVSGGSVGAAVFDALVAEKDLPSNQNFTSEAEGILGRDFLSPTLASMLFPDLLQRFWPFPVRLADRGAVLEEAWESGWRKWLGPRDDRFAQPLRDLWQPATSARVAAGGFVPALFLNGTAVGSGKRVLASDLPITSGAHGELIDVEDVYEMFGEKAASTPPPGVDLRLSTAAHLGARFTYVSPAGLLPDGEHVVDGGYFENSGAATALEIVRIIKGIIGDQGTNLGERIVPVVLMISNGPIEPNPSPANNMRSPAPSTTPEASKPAHPPEFLAEILDPLSTMLDTRDGRGSFSEQAINKEQQPQAAGPSAAQAALPGAVSGQILDFELLQRKVPLPLGWMLSGGAAIEMREQIKLDDDTGGTGVQNNRNVESILRDLDQLTGD